MPAAPLDPAALHRVLAPFGESRLLPRAAYTDPDVLDWEREHFFRRGWVCLGRGEDLPQPGDQRAVRVGEESALLVRGDDGVLRAFANACRHRGHELLPCDASTRKRAIVCPYHGWGYALDGSLKGAPNFRDVADFDKSEFPLLTIAAREWQGYVFVDLSGEAGPLEEHLGDLGDVLGPYDIGSLRTLVRHDYVVEANWKVLSENYNECYHCPSIHPELCAVSPPESGDEFVGAGAWVGGWMELEEGATTMSLDGVSHGVPIPTLSGDQLHTVGYVDVFPNLLVSLHPDYVMTHLVTPLTPTSTHVECSWAFPREVADREGFDPSYASDFWDVTNRQDWDACEAVQRGLRAREWTPGPIAPLEGTVYRFETMLASGYLGQPVRPAPREEIVAAT